jgi:hypothetical protein
LQLAALAGGQVGPVLQPQPAGLLELGPGGDLLAAHRVDGFGELGGQVEPVEGQLRVGQVLGDAGDDGRAHVRAGGAHPLGVAAVRGQVRRERLDRARVAALGREQHPPGVQIGEQTDVVLALAGGGLVHPDPPHRAEVLPSPGELDVVLGDAPQQRVVLAHGLGDLCASASPWRRSTPTPRTAS